VGELICANEMEMEERNILMSCAAQIDVGEEGIPFFY
jgi:hypothetical protein